MRDTDHVTGQRPLTLVDLARLLEEHGIDSRSYSLAGYGASAIASTETGLASWCFTGSADIARTRFSTDSRLKLAVTFSSAYSPTRQRECAEPTRRVATGGAPRRVHVPTLCGTQPRQRAQREPVGGGTPSWRQIARAVPVGISRCRGTGVLRSSGTLPRWRGWPLRASAGNRARKDAPRIVGASSGEVDCDLLDVAPADRRFASLVVVGGDHLTRGVDQQRPRFLHGSSARHHSRLLRQLRHRPAVLVGREDRCQRQPICH